MVHLNSVSSVPRVSILVRITIHDSTYAISKLHLVKSDQQSKPKFHQPEVRQDLCLINRVNRLFRFELDDDPSINEQVSSESAVQFDFVIDNGNRFFLDDIESISSQFIGKANSVGRFEQPRSQASVNFNCCTNDGMGKFAFLHGGSIFLQSTSADSDEES